MEKRKWSFKSTRALALQDQNLGYKFDLIQRNRMSSKLEFKYFAGPANDMFNLLLKEDKCSLCGKTDYVFKCRHCNQLVGNWDCD